ncbi:MAG: aminoacyl-tRNA hydrolase [Clostridia bacterium]
MKIVIGLGNPGREYVKTRHNLGFMFIEFLEKKYMSYKNRKALSSLIYETSIGEQRVIFVKPQTYMNLSGEAVQKVKNWYKVENEDILIVFDDIDIDFGDIKYKENGSGGSHNGMKNIVQVLGTKEIPRLRIGTGNIKHEDQDITNFVLEKFSKQELSKIEDVFIQAEDKFKEFIKK